MGGRQASQTIANLNAAANRESSLMSATITVNAMWRGEKMELKLMIRCDLLCELKSRSKKTQLLLYKRAERDIEKLKRATREGRSHD